MKFIELGGSAVIRVGVILGYGWPFGSRGISRSGVELRVWSIDSCELGGTSPFSKIDSAAESCCERRQDLRSRLRPGRWRMILMNSTMTAMENRTAMEIPITTLGIA